MEKIQRRKVGVAGGFINQISGNNKSEPIVGEGATILHYSDRSAYEVIAVSDSGNECTIRKMTTKFVKFGSVIVDVCIDQGGCFETSYGDEKYEFISDETNYTKNLEWNAKKGKWGEVGYKVEVIKSLQNRLWKEYDYDWVKHLPQGLAWDDLFIKEHEDNYYNKMEVIKGVTKEYKNFHPVSIAFGMMSEYRDPYF